MRKIFVTYDVNNNLIESINSERQPNNMSIVNVTGEHRIAALDLIDEQYSIFEGTVDENGDPAVDENGDDIMVEVFYTRKKLIINASKQAAADIADADRIAEQDASKSADAAKMAELVAHRDNDNMTANDVKDAVKKLLEHLIQG